MDYKLCTWLALNTFIVTLTHAVIQMTPHFTYRAIAWGGGPRGQSLKRGSRDGHACSQPLLGQIRLAVSKVSP